MSEPMFNGAGNPLVDHGKLLVFPSTELVCKVKLGVRSGPIHNEVVFRRHDKYALRSNRFHFPYVGVRRSGWIGEEIVVDGVCRSADFRPRKNQSRTFIRIGRVRADAEINIYWVGEKSGQVRRNVEIGAAATGSGQRHIGII